MFISLPGIHILDEGPRWVHTFKTDTSGGRLYPQWIYIWGIISQTDVTLRCSHPGWRLYNLGPCTISSAAWRKWNAQSAKGRDVMETNGRIRLSESDTWKTVGHVHLLHRISSSCPLCEVVGVKAEYSLPHAGHPSSYWKSDKPYGIRSGKVPYNVFVLGSESRVLPSASIVWHGFASEYLSLTTPNKNVIYYK